MKLLKTNCVIKRSFKDHLRRAKERRVDDD